MTEIKHGMGRDYYKISASPSRLNDPVSKSLLWFFYQSPYKFLNTPKQTESTPAMVFGSLAHCALLTPELLDEEFVISPFDKYTTNESREWREAQAGSGKMIVKQEEWDRANDISDTVRSCHEFPMVYSTEVAVFSDIGDVSIKGMIDIVPEDGNALYDLKTTANIESLDELQRTILSRGYHWQAALYLDLWNAATGETRDEFVFIFVETKPPYETAFVRLSSDFINLGRSGAGHKYPGYLDAVRKWKECVRTDHWPKRVENIQTIDIPAWVTKTK
jgi:exodeoxyribonuclease VIII